MGPVAFDGLNLVGDLPFPGLLDDDVPERYPGDDRDRNLDKEDRLPRNQLGQQSAEAGTDCGADRTRADPGGNRAAIVTEGGNHQLQRADDGHGASGRLDRAPGQQGTETGRQAADQAAPGKHGESDRRRTTGAEATGQVGRRYRQQGQHQVEDDQHPGDPGDGRVELTEDLRQGQHDDRGISENQPDRTGKCGGPQVHQYPSSRAYSCLYSLCFSRTFST